MLCFLLVVCCGVWIGAKLGVCVELGIGNHHAKFGEKRHGLTKGQIRRELWGKKEESSCKVSPR